VFTRPLGCHEAEQDNRHDALPAERATSLEGGGKGFADLRGAAIGPGRVREAPLPLKIRYALIAVPILMASLDLIENGCIAVMLWTWPDLSHGLVEISSHATRVKMVKIMAGGLTEALMAALAVIWLMRWATRHRA